ncbi:MAG: molybdenum cofactor cytidylyltransferase [Flavobacteriales bacterium]|jgi:molybdenum cofactor cytidylyltransferase|uniref:nucleotidyltransferase family protein n=1 Tax=Psychroserpens sp. TaxID=2020870 RepID=UPI0039E4530B
MNIALVILSAGSSTRMGTAKQLLPVGDTTLLGVSIESALKSNSNKVFCVLGAHAKTIYNSISQYDIETIPNDKHEEGLSSSIVEGINYIEDKHFDAVLIMLGDQPKVDYNYLNMLVTSFEKNPTKISASKYLNNTGVPAIFPKLFFKQLQQLRGDKGAKDFLNAYKTQVISINSEKLIDIDTQEEYQNFLNSL